MDFINTLMEIPDRFMKLTEEGNGHVTISDHLKALHVIVVDF